MRYTAQKPVSELLLLAGYSRDGAPRGWLRPLTATQKIDRTTCIVLRSGGKKVPSDGGPRFHALIEDGGVIDLHIDRSVQGHHKSHKHNEVVYREVARLEALDNL